MTIQTDDGIDRFRTIRIMVMIAAIAKAASLQPSVILVTMFHQGLFGYTQNASMTEMKEGSVLTMPGISVHSQWNPHRNLTRSPSRRRPSLF